MPVSRDAITSKANVFLHSPSGMSGPDDLAIDDADGLGFANPGHSCVWIVDRCGGPKFKVESCAGSSITNLAFDPLDRHRLVLTDSNTGQVLTAKVATAGHDLSSHGP